MDIFLLFPTLPTFPMFPAFPTFSTFSIFPNFPTSPTFPTFLFVLLFLRFLLFFLCYFSYFPCFSYFFYFSYFSHSSYISSWIQCVANTRIFEYIQIFIDKYIHSPKYSWIFSKQIYSDIHSRLFLLLNIFRHSFGLLDSNEYIQMYSLNKMKLVVQQMLSNLIYI